MLSPSSAPQFLPGGHLSIAEAQCYLCVLRATRSRDAGLLLVPSVLPGSHRAHPCVPWCMSLQSPPETEGLVSFWFAPLVWAEMFLG